MEDQLKNSDLLSVIHADIHSRTILGHHIDSFNNFATEGINQIITQGFKVMMTIKKEDIAKHDNYDIDFITALIEFTDVNLTRPTRTGFHSGMDDPLYPNVARQQKLSYSSALYVDAHMTFTAILSSGEEIVRKEHIKDVKIADIPCMIGSKFCHTYDMTKSEKKDIEEDPQDIGGYFILGGSEWVISCMESRLFNIPHIFRNIGHKKEITRLEILSKPGDAYENSSEMIIVLMNDDNIYISFTDSDYLAVQVPFYVIFKLFGMVWQKEIVDNIVYGYSDKERIDVISDHMMEILIKAFDAKNESFQKCNLITNRDELLQYTAEQYARLKYVSMTDSMYKTKENENSIEYIKNNILSLLDIKFLPHIGMTSESRHKKLRYLGHLIHQLILVEYQIVESTDRDSLRGKRINAAGRSYAKVFKRSFNTSIIYPLKHKIKNDFKSIVFDQVPLKQLFSAIDGSSLNKEIVGSITRGDKEITINNRKVRNNLSSEQISRKNQLHVLAAMRSLKAANSSSNKGSRSKKMRQVHSSYIGYICLSQSTATGPQVGIVKQLSVLCAISEPSSSLLVKKLLLQDLLIKPLEYIRPEEIYTGLTKVMVNGDWIGCTDQAPHILYKYRNYRRCVNFIDFETIPERTDSHLLNKTCTIHWIPESNTISFWTDGGRGLCLRLVVYNNGELDPYGRSLFKNKYDPFKDEGFEQKVLLSKEHVKNLLSGKIDIDYLLVNGIAEYISPEEMENCHIAYDIDVLYQNQNNSLIQYTHCEIPAGALLGLPALNCPFIEHNASARNTFNTMQTKQTQGIFALNWPYRVDKHAAIQYYCETPLVGTLANNYIYPNGGNVILAILTYGGGNMEDSLIFNKSASDRGFMKGNSRAFEMTELENNESFRTPDVSTKKIKGQANYSKMENGVVRVGTVVKKGDGLIGKVIKVSQDKEIVEKDKSILYKNKETGIIENVIIGQDNKSNDFIKVIYSTTRPLGTGDKFSSRAGQKGMTGIGYYQEDMPFAEDGLIPDLILSPQAIPSRMTVGQLLETLASILSVATGTIYDASAFCKSDPVWLGEQLVKYGFRPDGTKRMFSGYTGEWIDTMVFIGPNYYQRLQKFVIEQIYSITTGSRDIITRQPLDGKANRGGLRISELAKDVISAHGTGHFMMEKLRTNSDDFDIYVCRTCGKRPVVNEVENKANCKNCSMLGLTPDIYKCHTKYASKLVMQELESVGIGVRLEVQPFTYEVYEEQNQ